MNPVNLRFGSFIPIQTPENKPKDNNKISNLLKESLQRNQQILVGKFEIIVTDENSKKELLSYLATGEERSILESFDILIKKANSEGDKQISSNARYALNNYLSECLGKKVVDTLIPSRVFVEKEKS